MQKNDFYFDLPPELIAQTPVEPRDASRLLVLDKMSGAVSHRDFTDILELLDPGDLLVLNDSRVLPARLLGLTEEGERPAELLLLEQKGPDLWETLARPGKRARIGARFVFGDGLLRAEVVDIAEEGNRLVRFEQEGSFFQTLDTVGQMPLPPYITEKLDDPERYQTIYARELGSAAAPTAGLHFTDRLLDRLAAKGIERAFVTLHVGLGTFRPVKENNITDHKMHEEHFRLPQATADAVNAAKARGNRIIAVGTTSCRTLEAVGRQGTPLGEFEGRTDIFLYPGKQFRVIDGLITNFHLPESTLIMLVSALAGREHILTAYRQAVEQKYRFFSFGDAMLIL